MCCKEIVLLERIEDVEGKKGVHFYVLESLEKKSCKIRFESDTQKLWRILGYFFIILLSKWWKKTFVLFADELKMNNVVGGRVVAAE